jgi:hypothetical protein
MGAGEAGTGIGELIAIALEQRHGLTREQVRLPTIRKSREAKKAKSKRVVPGLNLVS